MKAIAIIRYVFILVGIGMLVSTFPLYKDTSSFVFESAKADGTVVDLVRSRSRDSTTYRPIVNFTNQRGEKIEFISSAGSNPPIYSKGQRVVVLYDPSEPQNAKINSFFSLWGGPLILGGLGSVFFLVGVGITFAIVMKNRKDEFLKKNGTPIETEFQSVERNTRLSVNGRHPFRVLSQWQNPATSEIHIFQSSNLWFDPSSYINSRRITVFIEKNNPDKYYVDLSFLPKLAK